MKELIAVEDTPRRRNPASVIKRGSSQPSTHFSITRRFNCNKRKHEHEFLEIDHAIMEYVIHDGQQNNRPYA